MTLTELFHSDFPVLTGHRGAPFDDAENTIPSFERAVRSGADIIEFDLRMTADHVPVLLHDPTLERTTDGTGRPEDYSFAELQTFNASYFSGGKRLEKPLYPSNPIPSFESVLRNFRDRACMNIQVYADPSGMKEICRLYLKYGMKEHGFLTIADWNIAASVREYSPEIEVCVTPGWHERALPENLKRCAEFGCRFVQPTIESVSPETFSLCRKLGLRANVFFSDDPEKARELFLKAGAGGVLTNRIPLLGKAFGKK